MVYSLKKLLIYKCRTVTKIFCSMFNVFDKTYSCLWDILGLSFWLICIIWLDKAKNGPLSP